MLVERKKAGQKECESPTSCKESYTARTGDIIMIILQNIFLLRVPHLII